MKISFINNLFKARKRKILRGYLLLKKSNRLPILNRINNKLCNSKLNVEFNNFSNLFSNLEIKNAEIILRQYLIKLLLGEELNKAILLSLSTKKGIIYPLPLIWQKVLEKEGFFVNNFFCSVVWIFFVLKIFNTELIKFFIDVFKNIIFIFTVKKNEISKAV